MYAYVMQGTHTGACISKGERDDLVDAYIIEGLRLPIAWSMMKTDPYP